MLLNCFALRFPQYPKFDASPKANMLHLKIEKTILSLRRPAVFSVKLTIGGLASMFLLFQRGVPLQVPAERFRWLERLQELRDMIWTSTLEVEQPPLKKRVVQLLDDDNTVTSSLKKMVETRKPSYKKTLDFHGCVFEPGGTS